MARSLKTTVSTRLNVYAAANYLDSKTEKELRIRIPFDVYLQDPSVAKADPKFGIDEDFYIYWEPRITDGPTSSRFAVVDYNGDTEQVAYKAKWDKKREKFIDKDGRILDRNNNESLQYHQVNVWAILQRALAFFENGEGLGRTIPFGFEGNRLIVVPHAGYGKNAFYDRKSKSLQFYYFDHNNQRIYTCLSTDIINHEFGHAILDGIRPYYFESTLIQTAAFHEFLGDLTAILIILTNKKFRKSLAEQTKGDLGDSNVNVLSAIADEFGEAVSDRPYLRSAANKLRMSDVANSYSHHEISQVLTGAMFDILKALTEHYIKDRGHSVLRSFEYARRQMQRLCIQPLDLLPPVDVTFKDYALAVLRAQALANPTDPYNHYDIILDAFVKREILAEADIEELKSPKYLVERLILDVYHDIDKISRSRAEAYRFLDDNRSALLIPQNQNLIIADLYDANKYTRQGLALPRQVILEYIWREKITLSGARFEEYQDKETTILCGGTLVFNDRGAVHSWFRKPGTEGGNDRGNLKNRREEYNAGVLRQKNILDNLAERIRVGHVGAALGSSKGLVGELIPTLTASKENEIIKFEISPHLHLAEDHHKHAKSLKKWQISS